MRTSTSRRSFLRSAPLAAAAVSFASTHALGAQPSAPATEEPFRLITADALKAMRNGLNKTPGNTDIITTQTLPLTIVMTNEEGKFPKEFEWHETRDHIFQILEGTTVYELGGTPQNPRKTKPGEWLATSVTGAQTVTLQAGDMLVIPRGTPHKRTTAGRVTLILISDTAPAPVK